MTSVLSAPERTIVVYCGRSNRRRSAQARPGRIRQDLHRERLYPFTGALTDILVHTLSRSAVEVAQDREHPAMVDLGGWKVKLGEDVVDVLLHRARADIQAGGDAVVGAALGHESQYIKFPGGE